MYTICVCQLKILWDHKIQALCEREREKSANHKQTKWLSSFDKNDFVPSIWSQLNIYSLYEQIIKIYHLRCADH